MIVRSLETAEALTTADGSTIRELLGLPTAPVRNAAAGRVDCQRYAQAAAGAGAGIGFSTEDSTPPKKSGPPVVTVK